MPRVSYANDRKIDSAQCAAKYGRKSRWWRRYWSTRPALVRAALGTRYGRKTWPESVVNADFDAFQRECRDGRSMERDRVRNAKGQFASAGGAS